MTILRLIILLICALATADKPLPAQSGDSVPVVTTQVIERTVTARRTYVANLYPNRRAVVGSAVEGRVEQFPAKAGLSVSARQPLAELRTRVVGIQRDGAIAELQLRQHELEELVNGSLPEEILLAEAQFSAARADLRYAQSRFERAERLFKDSVGFSQEEYEAAQAAAQRAQAMLQQAENQLQLIRNGPRPERISQAKAKVEVQRQVIESIEDRLEKFTVRAPFDGYVSRELTETGAWLRQGESVAEVVEIDPIKAIVNVPESNIAVIRVGMTCPLSLEAYPDRTFAGQVALIVPEGDLQSRSFPVHIQLENPRVDERHVLLPGMTARVSLPTRETQTVLLVPKDALILAGANARVIKISEGKAFPVNVRKGASYGGLIEVRGEPADQLQSGDVIVVRGNERLRPNQAVVVRSTIDADSLMEDSFAHENDA